MARLEYHRLNTYRYTKYLMTLAWISMLVYVVNRWFVLPQADESGFLSNYLGDMLALPVYLPWSLYLAHKLDVITEDFRMGFLHILAAVIIFSVIFEGIVPMIVESSTRDPWDMLAYFTGGLMVYGLSIICAKKMSNKEAGK